MGEHPESGAKLFIGNETTATSLPALESIGVKRIVRCLDFHGEPGAFESDPDFQYLHFPIASWRDARPNKQAQGIAKIFAPLLGFVGDSLDSGSHVLIHCLAGAHRAGTSGIACLMHLCNLDAGSATCAAKAARPSIDSIAHLGALLRKLERARAAGAVAPAIQ